MNSTVTAGDAFLSAVCTQCGSRKVLIEFPANRSKANGRATECRDCRRVYMKKRRIQMGDEGKRRKRDSWLCNRDHVSQERKAILNARAAEYYDANAPQINARRKARHAANPMIQRARDAVRRAVKKGSLIKPVACWACGAAPVTAHHASYDEDMRLSVTWLCHACHGLCHRETGNG